VRWLLCKVGIEQKRKGWRELNMGALDEKGDGINVENT
jgi:hypothetical protein